MVGKLNLTRNQLASFLKDHDQIRQFEELFETVSTVAGDDIILTLGATDDKAQEALDKVNGLLQAVDYLMAAPRYEPEVSSGSSAVNTASGEVDFGYASGGEGNFATVTVAAAWASSASTIICTPKLTATADQDPDDYAVEGLKAYATNIVDGVGFDIVVMADYATWGRYNVEAIGV